MARDERWVGGLAVDESGPPGAPVVVLVHGSMDRASGMAKTARRLDDTFRVVRYDRRGYARSLGVGAPFGIDAQVDDLLAVLGGRTALLVGHSLGGDIALATAERHPRLVAGVLVYEPPMPWEPWWPDGTAGGDAVKTAAEVGPEAAADRFLSRMVGPERWALVPAATKADRLAEGVALVGEIGDLRAGAPFDPHRVHVPVLAAFGGRTAPQHQQSAVVLGERLADVEVVEVPSANHGIHLDQPDELASLVRRLAARAGWAPKPPPK